MNTNSTIGYAKEHRGLYLAMTPAEGDISVFFMYSNGHGVIRQLNLPTWSVGMY